MQELMALRVEGMTCTNCANTVKKYLESQGLEEVKVDYINKEVKFYQPDSELDWNRIKLGLQGFGYRLVIGEEKPVFWTLQRKWIFSAIFATPLLLIHIFPMIGIQLPVWLTESWVQMIICLPVFILGSIHFGKSAIQSLKLGTPNMDVLIFMGGTTAFIYSLVGTLQNNPNLIFYETSATIFALVLIGHWIEERSVTRTTSAIDELSGLEAEKARMVMPDGNFIWIDTPEIRVGDFLQVNSGDSVPSDGEIIKGEALIDESMLTGESEPVNKKPGDFVTGASIVTNGNFVMKTVAVGNDTVLANIISMVKEAQSDKPLIQRLADRISAIFVPGVILIALITWALSYLVFSVPLQQSILNSIAVLVISCPCAMGLATPTAVMVGVGRLAKEGILVKGGRTVEDFAQIKDIIFDKTGTLTSGDIEIEHIQYNGLDRELVDTIIYTMESSSSHPIAKALTQHLQPSQTNQLVLTGIEEESGSGMRAEDNEGHLYKLGSAKYTGVIEFENAHIHLTRDDKHLASIYIKDRIKDDAKQLFRYFRDQEVKTHILSGDRVEKTENLAKELNPDFVHAEKSPSQKLDIIDQIKKSRPVAMVGDGINDAPALQKATVSLAMSDASKIAMQSSKIVLLDNTLSKLMRAFSISKATLSTIKQNLFWAFAYNVVAIPIAAFGYLNPMWGAFFMAFSDLVVIGNSLRLKYKKV